MENEQLCATAPAVYRWATIANSMLKSGVLICLQKRFEIPAAPHKHGAAPPSVPREALPA